MLRKDCNNAVATLPMCIAGHGIKKIMDEFIIHNRKITGSTNEDAVALARNGAPAGTVVVAEQQTHGSGRQKRLWHSPKGNLYFSVILRGHTHVPAVSFAAALSVGITIEQIFADYNKKTAKAPLIKYKWPNDVLVDGKKICGVLLQAEPQKNKISWIVCGVGINILSSPEYATSISDHCPEFTLPACKLLNIVLENFAKVLDLFSIHGFPILRRLWLKRAYKINEHVSIATSSGTIHEGKFVDIHFVDGSIMLKSYNTVSKINYGEML